MTEPLNERIAEHLIEAADLLQAQGANPFRINAYRRAAETLHRLDRDVGELAERGDMKALIALPGIGRGIATAIYEMVATGRWERLERLRGESDPLALFRSVPGIGPELARRIHDELQLEGLEALEAAAHDGRLAQVQGMGPRRIAGVRASLANLLNRIRGPSRPPPEGPDVGTLLAVDREYHEAVRAGNLPRIAPRRFNPEGEAWLPLLHTQHGDWHFTAMFSNTARAHELGRTRDWVVIYFYDSHHQEGQHTVVTETRGALIGRRVVRGREAGCREHYSRMDEPDHDTATLVSADEFSLKP